VTRVHQIVSGAGPYDAVSVQARLWRELLSERGFGGADHAAVVDPRARRHFEPLDRLDVRDGDLLVIRYSAYSPRLLPLLDLPNPMLLVYHNVTPPGYFWNHNAGVAVACAVGRAQLPLFIRAASLCVADSHFNAGELTAAGATGARVLPILFDSSLLGEQGRPPAGDGPLVLVVSRLAPNKRHDLVIAAFAAWRAEHSPGARLLCVGEAVSPSYVRLVAQVAAEQDDGAVTLSGGLSQPDLNAAYSAADAVLSMSEHEGFSVPLLEAFHFGVPVVARPAGAMPEVGGDAVLWDRGDDLAETAELLELAVGDAELRAELGARGRARLEAYDYGRTAEGVVAAVEEAAGL
jgi:glycosyltransferase involved in cell wall biosynthesis